MKNLKKVLALVLAVAIMMSIVVTASAKDYSDVKDDTNYADAIDALSGLGILDGFTDGSFQPEGTLTRAQAAKIVAIVHNAATNKKIQSDIADLYKNAQNSFVDCNGSWALPYINYCRITGLADGMTATTYEPNRVLTGVQFLKLMLTTLGFDTAKEGYTGTGWDINVLNRANEIGLTAGLADGWQGIKELKRGEAAQILYNALTKYIVEYGQLIKIDSVKGTYKNAFVSNEHVAQSGYTLGAKMNITIARATDDYRRPGYAWSYGTWKAFYMDTPVATYTAPTTECEVLKAMGVAETKNAAAKTVKLNGYVGGDSTSEANKVGKKFAEALNYYAVDGYKYTDLELAHDTAKTCQTYVSKWNKPVFGGQGDLTQVFKTEDGFVVTTVHTFLAEVTSVKTLNRKDHATTALAKVKAYIRTTSDDPRENYGDEWISLDKEIDSTSYAKGSKLLVTLSLKGTEADGVNYKTNAYVVEYAAPETKTGKLTGASDVNYPNTVSIDGTQYNANCRFVLGKDTAMQYANRNTVYTFYFDTNGNVIGCTDVAASSSYVVMDKIYAEHVKGEYVLKADLYDLDGKAITDATISNVAGSFDGYKKGNGTAKTIDDIAANNNPQLTNALYTYTVDEKGVYTLTWVGVWNNGYGRYDGGFEHIAKRANIDGYEYNYDADGDFESLGTAHLINVTESTKFVVKGVDGTWKSYTGYTALPALYAQYIDYVDTDNDTYADIVYLGNAYYEGDKITGYVTNWAPFNWSGNYDVVTVYVKGEAVKVNVMHELNGMVDDGAGMYDFTMHVDKDGVVYATWAESIRTIKVAEGVATKSADGTAIQVPGSNYPAIGLTDVAIYAVHADGTITVETKDYIQAADAEGNNGDYVVLYRAAGSEDITEIYVYDVNPYNP